MLDWLITWLEILIFPGIVFAIIISLIYEWVDRKLYAKFQNRVGPLYTGPAGFLQPFADLIKLLSKEDITSRSTDRSFFNIIPLFSVGIVLTGICMLPIMSMMGIISFYGDAIVAIAILTLFCITVFLAGIFSVNRFSFVGAERAVSQLIGYEIPLTLALVGVMMDAGSIRISDIVSSQSNWWYILGPQAIGFAIFLIAAQAELERRPFDIPEAETEIVAGWLTEYSGRKLALFRLSMNLELFYISGLAVAFYLGGPSGPMIAGLEPLLHTVYFLIKTLAVVFILSLIKSLFARLRIDQMVSFSWKYLVPISLLQLLLVRVLI